MTTTTPERNTSSSSCLDSHRALTWRRVITARRRWWRGTLLLASLPTSLGVLLYVEVAIARRGPVVPRLDRALLQGRVGNAPVPAQRVVWLGDSTAAGVGAVSRDGALPRQVAELLSEPTELQVLARSGARVLDVLEDQLPGVASLGPGLVLVSVGANDVTHATSSADFTARYRRLLDRLPKGARVVILGVPDMGAAPRLLQPLRALSGWRGRQLERALHQVATQRGLDYVDIGGTGRSFRRDPRRYFAPDGYHPNDAGYGLWAQAVVKVLRGGS